MKLFLDACSIIYLIESHQQQGQNTRLLIKQALQNKTQLVVSRLSFLECRVLPLKEKNDVLLERYNQFFSEPGLQIIELTADVINMATDLRANHSTSLRTPDALQIACALTANADQFLTGDKKLSVIQEIDIDHGRDRWRPKLALVSGVNGVQNTLWHYKARFAGQSGRNSIFHRMSPDRLQPFQFLL